MAAISLSHIRKSYGTVAVVHDFSLEIEDKEFIVLVGPSGCGKSTTLRMIAGLEEISSGELKIGDVVVNDLESKDRDIAMVFQNYALYPHMTVYKNMAFGLQLRKAPKAEIDAKVREAARILDIVHLLNRKPKQLSGGQRQRVALGRAMVRDPAVFLLDEPLSNLDAKLRSTMRVEIAKLHKRLGTTFVYVTHDQVEAMTMADRIVVMRDGHIQQVDTPQHLYDNPCNMFVAGFIGSPQMNMLPVTIERAGEGFQARFGDHAIPLPERAGEAVLGPWVGRACMLGIRPEDLYDAALATGEVLALTVLPATVELAEPMGSEIHLNLVINGSRLIARVPPRSTAREAETVMIGIDITKLHLFDTETEATIFN